MLYPWRVLFGCGTSRQVWTLHVICLFNWLKHVELYALLVASTRSRVEPQTHTLVPIPLHKLGLRLKLFTKNPLRLHDLTSPMKYCIARLQSALIAVAIVGAIM